MFTYTSPMCIKSLMNRFCKPFENWQGYQANRNKAVLFDENLTADYPTIHYYYIYNKPNIKHYHLTQLISHITPEFFELSGKKWREIRETRNKFDKIVSIKEYNQKDVLGLIDVWDKTAGVKYGFQRRSGRDRNFFNKWFKQEQDKLFARFFYIEDDLIGYSVLHKNNGCYEYLIRKTLSEMRNTCLYVDYKTMEEIHQHENDFYVNWGASKGKLLKYKKKFPVFEERPVYFYKVSSK